MAISARARHRILSVVVLAACRLLTGAAAHADTVVSTSGTVGSLFSNNPEGVSWTLTGSYTGVSVAALISSGSASEQGAGTFYLTNSVGPATTAANVIAQTTITGIAYAPTSDETLFSGLSLGPGTYYLISNSSTGTGGVTWEALTGAATITTAPDASFNGGLYSLQSNSFVPGDTFDPLFSTFVVDVTGTPAAAAVTPEPASVLLLATGVLGAVAVSRRRFA